MGDGREGVETGFGGAGAGRGRGTQMSLVLRQQGSKATMLNDSGLAD